MEKRERGEGEEGREVGSEGEKIYPGLDTRREGEALSPHSSITLLNDLVSPS